MKSDVSGALEEKGPAEKAELAKHFFVFSDGI